MEAYKSICPDCKKVYFWQGYKTGIGKTPEQLEKMNKQHSVCKYCGSTNLNTELDRESEVGQVYDDFYKFVSQQISDAINNKLN